MHPVRPVHRSVCSDTPPLFASALHRAQIVHSTTPSLGRTSLDRKPSTSGETPVSPSSLNGIRLPSLKFDPVSRPGKLP
jgi:hypothetical protein